MVIRRKTTTILIINNHHIIVCVCVCVLCGMATGSVVRIEETARAQLASLRQPPNGQLRGNYGYTPSCLARLDTSVT